jgi:hypothetical protein
VIKRFTIDTNVLVVANGGHAEATPHCKRRCIQALEQIVYDASCRAVVDSEGDIQKEYSRYCNPAGQPGVGDRFYQQILHYSVSVVERVPLPKNEEGRYLDLPEDIHTSNFDFSDRKFAALACKENIPVVNAKDTDWSEHRALLSANGIHVIELCGL